MTQPSDSQQSHTIKVTFSAMQYAMLEVAAEDTRIDVRSLVKLAAIQQARRIIDDIISDIGGTPE